jgi:uncharacterized protein (TIGR03067 family)
MSGPSPADVVGLGPGGLEDSWDEPALPEHEGRDDLEALQGRWVSVAGRRPAELLISGSHYTVRFADGAIYMGALELTPETRPRAMDMLIHEGPAHHKGRTALCIYELDGSTLRWGTTGPGRGERLTTFPAEDGGYVLCLVFRRELPG